MVRPLVSRGPRYQLPHSFVCVKVAVDQFFVFYIFSQMLSYIHPGVLWLWHCEYSVLYIPYSALMRTFSLYRGFPMLVPPAASTQGAQAPLGYFIRPLFSICRCIYIAGLYFGATVAVHQFSCNLQWLNTVIIFVRYMHTYKFELKAKFILKCDCCQCLYKQINYVVAGISMSSTSKRPHKKAQLSSNLNCIDIMLHMYLTDIDRTAGVQLGTIDWCRPIRIS